jgi:Outer membrane protein Omp28
VKRTYTIFLRNLLLLAIATLIASNFAFAAKRNILIEEATGDWCGPCGLYGKPAMKAILEQYKGSVFGVEIHINDDYQISYGYLVFDQYGEGGVPTGWINRMPVFGDNSDNPNIHPMDWEAEIPKLLPGEAECEALVSINHTVDKANGLVIIDMSATFESVDLITEDYFPVLNFYILENGIIGKQVVTGEGTLEPYTHNHVARYIEAPNGVVGSFPATVEVGVPYTKHFEVAIDGAWNADNLEVIGTVMYYDKTTKNALVINSAMGNVVRPFDIVRNPDDPSVFVGATSEKFTYSFDITNILGEEDEYELILSMSDRTPDDWSVNTEQAKTFTLDDQATQKITFELVAGATVGIGEAQMTIRSKNSDGFSSTVIITALHENIENIEIVTAGENVFLADYQNIVEDLYTITSKVALAVGDELTNIKLLIYNSGANGRISDTEAALIKTYLDADAKVFISGGAAAFDLSESCTQVKILPMLGVQYVNQSLATGAYKIKGYDDDPISDGFSINASRQTHAISYLSSIGSSARDFLKIDGENQPIACRSSESDNKAVVLGFNINDISNDMNKSRLLNAILEWIQSDESGGSVISVQGDVMFDRTKISKQNFKTLIISNDGSETLVINDLKVDESFSSVFTFPEVYIDGLFEPFDIEPESQAQIICVFTPTKAKVFETIILIESNSSNVLPNVTIKGEGFDPNGVDDNMSDQIVLEVLPNPVSTGGKLHYKLLGNSFNGLSIDLVDLNGRVVSNLVNSSNAQLEDSIEIPIGRLSSGTYYAVAKYQGKYLQVQVVVAK